MLKRLSVALVTLLVALPLAFAEDAKSATEAKPSPPKVIVFAVNGAEWDILRPLLIQGQMPNLKKVLDNGTFGKLKTISEPNCPKVFTTFATSVPPEFRSSQFIWTSII